VKSDTWPHSAGSMEHISLRKLIVVQLVLKIVCRI
jgi:hypothetical protein